MFFVTKCERGIVVILLLILEGAYDGCDFRVHYILFLRWISPTLTPGAYHLILGTMCYFRCLSKRELRGSSLMFQSLFPLKH